MQLGLSGSVRFVPGLLRRSYFLVCSLDQFVNLFLAEFLDLLPIRLEHEIKIEPRTLQPLARRREPTIVIDFFENFARGVRRCCASVTGSTYSAPPPSCSSILKNPSISSASSSKSSVR